jgi:hypothetical protein
MSLTRAHTVFAGLHETGVNDLVEAFYTARPRHFNYRSSPTVPGPPAAASAWTAMPPIPFPGTGGIHWGVQFELPRLDFSPNCFSVRTTFTLTVLCGSKRDQRDQERAGGTTPLRTRLELWAVGRAIGRYFGGGAGEVTFEVDEVELVDVAPGSLESVLECLVKSLLGAALANVRLPFQALTAGAFSLALAEGPVLEDDQAKLWGNIV